MIFIFFNRIKITGDSTISLISNRVNQICFIRLSYNLEKSLSMTQSSISRRKFYPKYDDLRFLIKRV